MGLDGLRMITSRFDRVDVYRDQKYDKIKKNLTEKKIVFDDVFFPPNMQSLGSQVILGDIEWKRPKELSNNPRLFDNNEGVTIVKGGDLSSNWIVSALSVLACIKELCYKVIQNYRDQDWKPDSGDGYTGIFHFRFWRFGQWVEVVVDDFLPVHDGKLIYTHSMSPDEFWVSLVEKAYAKLLGSYEALEEGHISDALVDMTGGITEIIDLKAGDYETNEELRAEFFQMLSSEMADHSIMCASIGTHSQDETGHRTEMGLVRGQAYQITAVKRIHLGESKIRNLFRGREKVSMVRLRDPNGSVRSLEASPSKSIASNPESDGEYAYSTAQLTRLLSKNPAWAKIREYEKTRLGLTLDHEGEFWMPVEDFVTNLEELTIVRFYNNNLFARGRRWKESALKGTWATGDDGPFSDRSGGGNPDSETFLRNPQFLFDIESPDFEVVIQMLQWEGREAVVGSPNRTQHRTLLIGFTVIRVESNRKYRLHKLWPFYRVAITVDHQRRRELYYRGHLSRGRYLLVPTTYKPGCDGNFLIRMVSQADVKLRKSEKDVPKKMCALSCVSTHNNFWITVISIRSAVGIAGVKSVYCSLKWEYQKVRSQTIKTNKETEWNEEFILYRKTPEKPIILKLYSHNVCVRDTLIGWAEIPATVNHTFADLEVNLVGKDNSLLENTMIRLKVFTEDNLQEI